MSSWSGKVLGGPWTAGSCWKGLEAAVSVSGKCWGGSGALGGALEISGWSGGSSGRCGGGPGPELGH